jgi:branched-chain amino acid transport system ATP-binding protein
VSRPRLRFEDLTGGYGSTTIVRDLAGAAIAGEALCILGRNGVGKTTLMKLLTGYLPCMRGRVLLDEQPITALDPAARRRQLLPARAAGVRRSVGARQSHADGREP